MKKRSILTIQLDDQGHLIIPPGISQRYGLTPGAKVRLEESSVGFGFSRSSANLARVYVEPTNICNLDCRTCMRNVWEEPYGWMEDETLARVLDGVCQITPRPLVFFGGFGEPLAHPRILKMIMAAKQTGAVVEMISNGILLNDRTARRLVDLGLDRLWISLDGATPESYADVRLGAALPKVIKNLEQLYKARSLANSMFPRLGIAFVAMRRNIHDLPDVVRLGKRLGADQISISNVLAHTEELKEEVLYHRGLYESGPLPNQWSPFLSIPRMDISELTGERLMEIMKGQNSITVARQDVTFGADTCPFVEKGSLSVRWDGAVSPCLALLHDHKNYLDDRVRQSKAYSVGNLHQHSLLEIWNDPQYLQLRENLLAFDFSPCTFCNSCEMADANAEDCFGNLLPACGGCLWAQGFIQCP